MVRDLDLPVPDTSDSRRVEAIDGLPLSGGCQLSVDITLMCALHCDGSQRCCRTCPEIVGPRSRARLVVLAVEVGGRWSAETRSFIAQLAKARCRQEPSLLRRRAKQAWRMRWEVFLSCVVAKVVAGSPLESRCAQGADGDTLTSWEVEADHRHVGKSVDGDVDTAQEAHS